MKLCNWLQPSYESNLSKVYIRIAFFNMALYLPIWVVFLQNLRGLSLSEIVLIEAIFGITVVLAEVPTGAVADSIGRKASMVLASLLLVISAVWFGMASSLLWIIVAHTLWGIALSFESGAMIALFYESVQALGREDEYVKLRSRIGVIRPLCAAISSLLGGLIASFDLRFPYLIYALFNLIGLGLALLLKEPTAKGNDEDSSNISYLEVLNQTGKALQKNIQLRPILVYASILPIGSFLVAVVYMQPYAIQAGIAVWWLGVFSLCYQLGRMLGAALSERINVMFRLRTLLWWGPLMLVGCLFALAFFPAWLGLIISFGVGFVYMILEPGLEQLLLDQMPQQVRASLLSVKQLLYRGFLTIFEVGSGFIGNHWGLRPMFAVTGSVLLFLLWIVFYLWNQIVHRKESCSSLTLKEAKGLSPLHPQSKISLIAYFCLSRT